MRSPLQRVCLVLRCVVLALALATRGSLSNSLFSDCWSTLQSLPSAVSDSAGVLVEASDTIIVTGGYDNAHVMKNHTLEFNLTQNKWRHLDAMPVERAGHVSEVVDNYVYVIGGYTIMREPVTRVDRFDLQTETWEKYGAPLPVPIMDAGSVVVGHKIFVFGGMSSTKLSAAVYVLDITSNTWSLETTLPKAKTKMGVTLTRNKTVAVVVGGEDGLIPINSLVRYHFHTKTWVEEDQFLMHGVSNPQVVVAEGSGGRLYVSGGTHESHLGTYVTADFLMLRMDRHEWHARVQMPTALTKHLMFHTDKHGIIVLGGQKTVGIGQQVAHAYQYNGDQCISFWNTEGILLTVHCVASAAVAIAYMSHRVWLRKKTQKVRFRTGGGPSKKRLPLPA